MDDGSEQSLGSLLLFLQMILFVLEFSGWFLVNLVGLHFTSIISSNQGTGCKITKTIRETVKIDIKCQTDNLLEMPTKK